MSDLILRLQLDDDPEIVERDARVLLRQISESVDHNATRPVAPAEEGTRAGDAAMLGEIALAVVSSGALVALFDVLKAYFSRKSGATIVFKTRDGDELTVQADEVSGDSLDGFIARVEPLLVKTRQ